MILFSKTGFLEFNIEPGRPGHFQVSGWQGGDIERAFPGAVVEEISPDLGEARWRRYKAIVRKELVYDLLQKQASEIDYETVYRELPSFGHRTMLEGWQEMNREDSYQRWLRKTK